MIWDEMAVVGRIARTHGLRGQVIVNPETDFPEVRFQPGAELFIARGGRVDLLTVASARFHGERPVIGLSGVDSIDAAESLAGHELRVPVEHLAELPPDTYYRHDLIGCRVETTTGDAVGVVTDVEGTMGGSRLVVSGTAGEVLVPMASQICPVIDPGGKRIVIAPPDGLIDLNRRD
jgi:16S rRNA processing protein RimM